MTETSDDVPYKVPADDVVVLNGSSGKVLSNGEFLLEKPPEESSPSSSQSHQDRGWAWFVFAACFLGRIIINGTLLTFNIYFSVFLSIFHESRGLTALIGSVMWACYDSTAIISGFVVGKVGPRLTIIVGASMLTSSLVISSFATDAIQLIFTFGIMVGLGCQFVSMGSVCGLRIYFKRYLYFVQGVSSAGAGTGMLILGGILPFLIDSYGWRGAVVIQGGILLNLCIVGSIMFPVRMGIVKRVPEEPVKDRRICSIIFMELWSTLEFWCLFVTFFCFGFSYCMSIVLFKDYVTLLKLDDSFSLALSLLAVGDVIGRVASGIISSARVVNPVLFYSLVHYTEAALLFGFIGINGPSSLLACSLIYGVAVGLGNGLFYILPCHLYKTSVFDSAFPYLSTATGMGSLVGTPLAGFLTDQTSSYAASLSLAGASVFVAGSLLLFVYFSSKKSNTRQDQTEVAV